jgi:hypothetical protein|tara:strand:+ start:290 stop:625 length:336 start_codon:yes stop_codon:yes gene_type:complete
MPNSRFREIDYIETNELWQECEKDLLDSGTAPANVGSITLFKSVWKGHFSDVRVREHKKVDGKDRKRAMMRYLLRRQARQRCVAAGGLAARRAPRPALDCLTHLCGVDKHR